MIFHQQLHNNQEYSCRIPHHAMINKKIVYVVLFISHSYGLLKAHHFRYSEAEKLHEQIEKTLNQLRIQVPLPQFPGKSFFGSHNNTPQGIKTREYFNQLLRHDRLYALPIIKHLLPNVADDNDVENELSQLVVMEKSLQQYIFTIDSYQQLDDVVLYFVQIIDNVNKNKWRFKTRYSDLRDIHEALREGAKKGLPEFPKRRIFGITNDSPEQIEGRKKGLEVYLNKIFGDPQLAENTVLDYFIQNSKRESKKLQKFDEQKMMLRLKLKAKQMSTQEYKTSEKKINQSKLMPKKGLFIIREIGRQYEDDNTTLKSIDYSKSVDYSNRVIQQEEDHVSV